MTSPLDANRPEAIALGGAPVPPKLLLKRANRHGLVAGATGTGKTVSLQVLAEGFSARGVPVFVADVKGDLAGLARPGVTHPKLLERAQMIGLPEPTFAACPVIFWDLFGEQGHPMRTTISEMGPVLLSRLLELNDVQEGVINIAFRVADDQGLLLLDLKDLRAMLAFIAEEGSELALKYGNVERASVGSIQRRLLVLEQQGAEHFFGEPALDINDLLRRDTEGRGIVNILAADRLMEHPRLYATFLLWLLSELFEDLPEVGDIEAPKLVFFFDEAHLLFDDAPPALLAKVEQVVRLVRSKGVGIFFVTQNPLDIPDTVLGQLGNRVQHALRSFTPRDQRAVRAAAETFRANPDFDVANAIGELGVGEALVSTLDEKGHPSIVQRTLMCPPTSRMGAITPEERAQILAKSPVAHRYDARIDRASAFEQLAERATAKAPAAAKRVEAPPADAATPPTTRNQSAATGTKDGSWGAKMARSVGQEFGRTVGREILRGLLGGIRRG